MKPSEVPDDETNAAAHESAAIVEKLRAAIASLEIEDPDSLVVALSSLIVDAHAAAGNRTPAGIVGGFALAVTQLHLDHLPVDEMAAACAQMLRFCADRMMSIWMRTEIRPCRWCGRSCRFEIQLVLGGGSEYVTTQRCSAASRVLVGGLCEPSTISHVGEAKRSRGPRYKR